MDVEEVRRILFTRVQGFDSENAFKIMGYLLLQDWGEQDLLRIALGSEALLYSLITKAKKELGLPSKSLALQLGQSFSQSQLDFDEFLSSQTLAVQQSIPVSPFESKSPSGESFFMAPSSKFSLSRRNSYPEVNEQWSVLPPRPYMYDKTPISHGYQEEHDARQHPFFTFKDHDNYRHMQPKWVTPSPSLVDGSSPHLNSSFSSKPCLFFSRGYCKHGSNCRFVHANESEKSIPVLTFTEDVESTGSDDGFLVPASLDRLEQEMRELLRGRQAPVSIASLPQIYYERFGKSLQAEGYLTESQRHGKAGFSLTKLLMRLKGTVTLIERPHGQHAVVLMEDALQLTDIRGCREDYSALSASSRQIYLTFPSESTFTEEDVTIHFRAYGPVQDVRIPYQQKRMFGFVTFVYADTVRTILTEGTPHYICGARVLVKPYKEKGKVGDRKLHDRDQFKHVPIINHLPPVTRYHKEDQHSSNRVEDDRVFALEQKIAELQLSGSLQTQSPEAKVASPDVTQQQDQPLVLDFDPMGDGTLGADDGPLQSSNFKYVLDLLDGESKDIETTDSTIVTVARLDSKPLDIKFGNPDIADTMANSVQKMKSHHLNNGQNTLASQYSWGAPATLFARSVF